MRKFAATTRRAYLCGRIFTVTLLGVGLLGVGTAHADTPQSPRVQAMVKKGISYLSKARGSDEKGGLALVGLAMLKSDQSRDHPKIKTAVAACQAQAALVRRSGIGEHTYSTCICAIFLCELDAQKYRTDIESLMKGIAARQRPNGCWSYKIHNYDDTSQSQFGMLALWSAHNNGFQVQAAQVERALNWFLRVQDNGGGWNYDPLDPNRIRSNQSGTTPGMTAAGLGSVYVGSHLLGFTAAKEQERKVESGLPSALQDVNAKKKKAARIIPLRATGTNAAAVKSAQALGEAWFAKGGWRFMEERWKYYYIYGLERCMSFKEHVTGKYEQEPKWYNDGVAFLASQQSASGAWESQTGAAVGTAFAILFLTRSTQKSLQKVESGRVRGGKFLPDNLSQIMVDGRGKVADTTEIPPIELLMEQLANVDIKSIDNTIPEKLTLSTDPVKRASQIVRLRRMVMNGPYQARLTSVKTISRDRSIDHVPVLIYALSDPDYRVVIAAENGLRYISRRVNGFGLRVGKDALTKPQRKVAQGKWNAWYLSIRPDGALIE